MKIAQRMLNFWLVCEKEHITPDAYVQDAAIAYAHADVDAFSYTAADANSTADADAYADADT